MVANRRRASSGTDRLKEIDNNSQRLRYTPAPRVHDVPEPTSEAAILALKRRLFVGCEFKASCKGFSDPSDLAQLSEGILELPA
jgi:hypothetical protein